MWRISHATKPSWIIRLNLGSVFEATYQISRKSTFIHEMFLQGWPVVYNSLGLNDSTPWIPASSWTMNINFQTPYMLKVLLGRNIITFSIIPWLWVGTCGWILLLWNIGIWLSYIVNTNDAVNLATHDLVHLEYLIQITRRVDVTEQRGSISNIIFTCYRGPFTQAILQTTQIFITWRTK